MKLRLMGSADIVRGWAELLKVQFGVVGHEYPTRGNGNEIRYYVDIDDRLAANIVEAATDLTKYQTGNALPPVETSRNVRRVR